MKTGVLKLWRPRFGVLKEETFYVFKKKEDFLKGRAAKNSFSVVNISSIESQGSKTTNCFRIIVDGRSHVFCSPTAVACDRWIQMISRAQQQEKDSKGGSAESKYGTKSYFNMRTF